MPGRFFHWAAKGACRSALFDDGKDSVHGPSGGCSIEAKSPLSGRLIKSTAPLLSCATKAAPRFKGRAILGALTGKESWMPRLRARHSSDHGQFPQAGRLGVQMAEPKSISACAKSPARSGTRAEHNRCSSGLALGMG